MLASPPDRAGAPPGAHLSTVASLAGELASLAAAGDLEGVRAVPVTVRDAEPAAVLARRQRQGLESEGFRRSRPLTQPSTVLVTSRRIRAADFCDQAAPIFALTITRFPQPGPAA